jgi:hypothetical protein
VSPPHNNGRLSFFSFLCCHNIAYCSAGLLSRRHAAAPVVDSSAPAVQLLRAGTLRQVERADITILVVDAPANSGGSQQPLALSDSKQPLVPQKATGARQAQRGLTEASARDMDAGTSRPLGGERGGLLSHEQNLVRTALEAGSAVVIALNKTDIMSRQEASDSLRGLQQQLERMEDGAGIAVTVRKELELCCLLLISYTLLHMLKRHCRLSPRYVAGV